MAPLVTYQSDGTASVWTGISQALAYALSSATKISDQQGNVLSLQQLPNNGGFLVNGCPLNVWFGQDWLPGQIDALTNLGITQCLPNVTTDPVPTRCYYKDGSITTTLTTCPTTNNGSPLLQSENNIIDDVNNTLPWTTIILVVAGLYFVTRKPRK